MTAHELAKKLLDGPDEPVTISLDIVNSERPARADAHEFKDFDYDGIEVVVRAKGIMVKGVLR